MNKLIDIEKLKIKWQSLNIRERFYLKLGSIFIVLVIIYYGLISPLNNSIDNLQQQITAQRSLALWMQPRVKALRGEMGHAQQIQPISAGELLPTVDTRLKQTSFASMVTEISQTNNGSVRITFKSVPFDDLMSWLIKQWKTSHLAVSELDVEKGEKAGLVKATLTVTTTG